MRLRAPAAWRRPVAPEMSSRGRMASDRSVVINARLITEPVARTNLAVARAPISVACAKCRPSDRTASASHKAQVMAIAPAAVPATLALHAKWRAPSLAMTPAAPPAKRAPAANCCAPSFAIEPATSPAALAPSAADRLNRSTLSRRASRLTLMVVRTYLCHSKPSGFLSPAEHRVFPALATKDLLCLLSPRPAPNRAQSSIGANLGRPTVWLLKTPNALVLPLGPVATFPT